MITVPLFVMTVPLFKKTYICAHYPFQRLRVTGGIYHAVWPGENRAIRTVSDENLEREKSLAGIGQCCDYLVAQVLVLSLIYLSMQ